MGVRLPNSHRCRRKYGAKDARTWTQRINTSEKKWALQISLLADAYLAWKHGTSTLKTTNEGFTVQYVDVFGEYLILCSIYLFPNAASKISSSRSRSPISKNGAQNIGTLRSFATAASRQLLM